MPSDALYSRIYSELVKDANDTLGTIAYGLYKRDKIAFIQATIATHGRVPTEDELKVFYTQTRKNIETYRSQAQQLGEAYLHVALAERILQIEQEVRDSVLSQSVSTVLAEIKARKGVVAWLGDIAANLGVNIATILVIGFLLGGYQALARFNANVEKIANVPATNGSSADSAPPPLPGQPKPAH